MVYTKRYKEVGSQRVWWYFISRLNRLNIVVKFFLLHDSEVKEEALLIQDMDILDVRVK